MLESVLFYILAAVLLGMGLLVVTRTNPIASAIAMVVAFAALSALYALLSASLAAILQVLVYAGGIMVLVIFVIMLLNLRNEDLEPMKAKGTTFLAALLVLWGLVVGPVFIDLAPHWNPAVQALPEGFGTILGVGGKLFSEYLFPFEMLSLVLLTAIVGALVLAKRKL